MPVPKLGTRFKLLGDWIENFLTEDRSGKMLVTSFRGVIYLTHKFTTFQLEKDAEDPQIWKNNCVFNFYNKLLGALFNSTL